MNAIAKEEYYLKTVNPFVNAIQFMWLLENG